MPSAARPGGKNGSENDVVTYDFDFDDNDFDDDDNNNFDDYDVDYLIFDKL